MSDRSSGSAYHWRLDTQAGPAGTIAVLRLAGDIDMDTLPSVWAALITALIDQPADLVVDLSEIRFCGVRGFAVLAAIARVTATTGTGYAVSGLGRHLDHAAAQVWPDQHLVRHSTIAAAFAAIRAQAGFMKRAKNASSSS